MVDSGIQTTEEYNSESASVSETQAAVEIDGVSADTDSADDTIRRRHGSRIGEDNASKNVNSTANGTTASSVALAVMFCVLFGVILAFGVYCFCTRTGKWKRYQLNKTHFQLPDEEEDDESEDEREVSSIELDMLPYEGDAIITM